MTDRPSKPPDDGGNPEDGPILSPEELDLEADEHVTKIDNGRFVVSPDGRQEERESHGSADSSEIESEATNESDATSTPSPDAFGAADEPTGSGPVETGSLTEAQVHAWLERDLAGAPSRYSFDVTAKFDETVTQRRLASNDVVTVFESLILWYCQSLDRDTAVEEILGILLMESSAPVRLPPASLQRLVRSTGLDAEDSIGDLLAAVQAEDGFRV